MTIKLIAYGIAKDILPSRELDFELAGDTATIADLKQQLQARFPEFGKLRSIHFAINADYQDDTCPLHENDEVVIIPPVSGG